MFQPETPKVAASLLLLLLCRLDSTMGSLKFHFTVMSLSQNFQLGSSLSLSYSSRSSNVVCGLRKEGPRKPLWRSRVLTGEAIQAVQSLKLAKSNPSKLEEVFDGRLSRLLKADLMHTLAELQRQNEVDLALKVFNFVQKEVWYKQDVSLYCDMIQLLGKKKQIEMAEQVFSEVIKKGLQPNTRAFTEIIGAYMQVGNIEKAMETYELMKASDCAPDKLTFTILIRNLHKAGEEELLSVIKRECAEYMDLPEKFLQEIDKKNART